MLEDCNKSWPKLQPKSHWDSEQTRKTQILKWFLQWFCLVTHRCFTRHCSPWAHAPSSLQENKMMESVGDTKILPVPGGVRNPSIHWAVLWERGKFSLMILEQMHPALWFTSKCLGRVGGRSWCAKWYIPFSLVRLRERGLTHNHFARTWGCEALQSWFAWPCLICCPWVNLLKWHWVYPHAKSRLIKVELDNVSSAPRHPHLPPWYFSSR